jgi:P4 family phage/plasmid primase-like protien
MTPNASTMTYEQYIKQFISKPGEGYTHTRIPDKSLNVMGGAFTIPQEELQTFYNKYYEHVFINAKQEFLTEKQNIHEGPIMVDFDFRYDPSVEKRQHTNDHILDMIQVYFDEIGKIVTIKPGDKIPVFIFQKSDVNRLETVTKDGIHMMIGITMERIQQVMLRNRVIKEVANMWTDLPLKNTWQEVFDEGITRGHTNWQLYGSRKPGHKAYMMSHYFIMSQDEDNQWTCEEKKPHTFNLSRDFAQLSVQYTKYVKYDMPNLDQNPALKQEYELAKTDFRTSKKSGGGAGGTGGGAGGKKLRMVQKSNIIEIDQITNADQLKEAVDTLFESFDVREYELKETHNYTMCLPESYYEPYKPWLDVGFALHNTSEKLFLTWMMFSAKSSKFSYGDIPKYYEKWCSFGFNPDGLTNRSIMYWAKNDAPVEYAKARNETVNYYIDLTITSETSTDTATEVDLAVVLYHLYKDRFVCISIKNNTWYEFIRHRWVECDQGTSLRTLITRDMHSIYTKRHNEIMNYASTLDPTTELYTTYRKRSRRVVDICTKLKTTTTRNNIMREVRELFYDKDFYSLLDSRTHLMCFNNGVVDFKNKVFRKGQPDDTMSKTTRIDYVPYDPVRNAAIMASINDFMEKLFPVEELRNYMWEHLASCLIGVDYNQKFNIYTGEGSNGKSKLVELMSNAFGDYKATVPITMVTRKRGNIGGVSPEVAQLIGIRYAVMQEPSKGDQIDEGTLKELTGGDTIQARALFKDTISFIPQFKLIVCTNVMFDIKSNDDGTWRRFAVCDFMSKFCENPKTDDPDKPYQYLIDKRLDIKLKEWAPVFMSMLVHKVFKTEGIVSECQVVKASAANYRNSQDYLAAFIKDKIRPFESRRVRKNEVSEEFKKWYYLQYNRNAPKATEITNYMEKKYGKCGSNGWLGIGIIYNEEDELAFQEEQEMKQQQSQQSQ